MSEKFNFRVDGFLSWYNPYKPIGSEPPNHPNPYGVRIEKSVRIIEPSLSWNSFKLIFTHSHSKVSNICRVTFHILHHKSHQVIQNRFRTLWFGSSSALMQKLLRKFFPDFLRMVKFDLIFGKRVLTYWEISGNSSCHEISHHFAPLFWKELSLIFQKMYNTQIFNQFVSGWYFVHYNGWSTIHSKIFSYTNFFQKLPK